MVKKEEFLFDSRDGKSRIHAVRWVPEGKICCILQVVHGGIRGALRADGHVSGGEGDHGYRRGSSRTWKKCR